MSPRALLAVLLLLTLPMAAGAPEVVVEGEETSGECEDNSSFDTSETSEEGRYAYSETGAYDKRCASRHQEFRVAVRDEEGDVVGATRYREHASSLEGPSSAEGDFTWSGDGWSGTDRESWEGDLSSASGSHARTEVGVRDVAAARHDDGCASSGHSGGSFSWWDWYSSDAGEYGDAYDVQWGGDERCVNAAGVSAAGQEDAAGRRSECAWSGYDRGASYASWSGEAWSSGNTGEGAYSESCRSDDAFVEAAGTGAATGTRNSCESAWTSDYNDTHEGFHGPSWYGEACEGGRFVEAPTGMTLLWGERTTYDEQCDGTPEGELECVTSDRRESFLLVEWTGAPVGPVRHEVPLLA